MIAAAKFALVTLVSLAALEILVRAYIFDPSVPYIRTPGWRILVRHNDLLPHVSGDNHFIEINRLGLRGVLPPAQAKPLIAVLGGSTAEDWVLPEQKTWAKQLQQTVRSCAPDAFAANLGKGGVNARHHLLQLPETAGYMPDFDVYVVLMGLNDFLFDLRIHHPFELPPNWWRRQAFMSDRYDEGYSAVYALAKRLFKLYRAGSANASGPISDFGLYMEGLWKAYRNVKQDQWVNELPDLTAHLVTYRETIRKLKAFADARKKPIVFVTQPYVWSDSMSPETRAQIYAGFIGSDISSPKTKWYTSAALEKGVSSYNDALREMCKTENLVCVDVARLLPREAKYYYDDFHFSEGGSTELGRMIGNEIKKLVCRRPE